MKVLLTGASGFVGSHVLDSLRSREISAAVLLRPTSNRQFIESHLPQLDVRTGSISDPKSLDDALRDVTHVIHCAGCTKALHIPEFYETNHLGTRNVVEAINQRPGQIQRLVHISSLAAGGPATPDRPAREEDPPCPVSEYGRSKLAGEQEAQRCKNEYVILRPPAVYGPRDDAFLTFFKSVKAHLQIHVGSRPLALSLVFVKDLAKAIVACLTAPNAAGKIFYVASPEVTDAHALTAAMASQMKTWTLKIPVPASFLWPACVLQETVSRLTRRPGVLSRQKYAELTAPGWVCDVTRLRQELGIVCPTKLQLGLAETLAWYRQNGWL
ncbi:MAG TPA: NAD(P)-dependent oxidoreductase [Verrucomicrobiae bacterium]|nr:NAD(P)-dependent oxidoreductase [Verrucomicrobiae bacterium]